MFLCVDLGSVITFGDWLMHSVYTVSQKTSKIIFVITTSNFHQIWQFLADWWQIV